MKRPHILLAAFAILSFTFLACNSAPSGEQATRIVMPVIGRTPTTKPTARPEAIIQPTPTLTQHVFSGEGASVEGPFELHEGLAFVVYEHEGEHWFSVDLMDSIGEVKIGITLDFGPVDGSTLERIPHSGTYFLDIDAREGAIWAVGIGQ